MSVEIEKIIFNLAVLKNPEFISEISNWEGSQSVIVVFKGNKKWYLRSTFTRNGNKVASTNPFKFLEEGQGLGAAEIITSIDKDEVKKDCNLDLIIIVIEKKSLPSVVEKGVRV